VLARNRERAHGRERGLHRADNAVLEDHGPDSREISTPVLRLAPGKKLLVLAAVAGLSLTFASTGRSITWGQRDGNRQHTQGGGSPTFAFDGFRWFATSFFNSLNTSWLRLTQNNSVGAGGTCFGDSGGPDFLGTSNVIAATTITGDSALRLHERRPPDGHGRGA